MAPELLTGRACSNMVDFWSLGVLVYVMSFGRFPFEKKADHREMAKEIR
jgi:serine/threonine protein kinase